MRTLLIGLLSLAGAVVSANPYVLRYSESEPLSDFLNRYGLRLRATVPGKPIYRVFDPLQRPAQAIIDIISDDTDDDVSIEVDQIVRLPILSFPTQQQSGLALLNSALNDTQRVRFLNTRVPRGFVNQYPVAICRISASWTMGSHSAPIVAVIDTGVDPQHTVFAGSVLPGLDYISNFGGGSELTGLSPQVLAQINPTTTPLLRPVNKQVSNGHIVRLGQTARVSSGLPIGLGHGTMVAGAIRLVAPSARILPIRAFDQTGTGRIFDVIRGIHAAEARGARVVNLSLNTLTPSPELNRTCEEVSSRGVILVASAGNNGLTGIQSWPASSPKVTGVAAIGPSGARSPFSNAGANLVWVAAPGEAIMLPYPGENWGGGWGTSFAAPMVSGLAARMVSWSTATTYSDLQSALSRSTPTSNPDLGLGVLNVASSLNGL